MLVTIKLDSHLEHTLIRLRGTREVAHLGVTPHLLRQTFVLIYLRQNPLLIAFKV